MRLTPRIKICCIRDRTEAQLAIRHGASALGLVSAMPSGPGVIDEDTIADIAASVPPPIATFLLTCLSDADAIIDQQRRCGTNTLQLVDAVPMRTYAMLRRALPGISIVQVIHVRDAESVSMACEIAPQVDALLLDSGNPTLPIKQLGGTGRTHDWALSQRIVQECGKPVYLAGGLRADNVVEALAAVQPFAVDLCSGVRTDGRLDETKLAAFFAAVHLCGAPT
ncbi:MAG: phosphoribosylanthranilate isomerase [Rudaea sp.]